jgi:hypothetical protein
MKYRLKRLLVGVYDKWLGEKMLIDILVLTMTNRMMEEKEQVNQQINRTDKLLKLIEMSMNLKNDT